MLVANAIRYFVRSVEDDLEPSQTYDEVNKLLLLLHHLLKYLFGI